MLPEGGGGCGWLCSQGEKFTAFGAQLLASKAEGDANVYFSSLPLKLAAAPTGKKVLADLEQFGSIAISAHCSFGQQRRRETYVRCACPSQIPTQQDGVHYFVHLPRYEHGICF